MGVLDLIEYLKKINDLKEGVSSYAYEEDYKLRSGDTKKIGHHCTDILPRMNSWGSFFY